MLYEYRSRYKSNVTKVEISALINWLKKYKGLLNGTSQAALRICSCIEAPPKLIIKEHKIIFVISDKEEVAIILVPVVISRSPEAKALKISRSGESIFKR